MNDTETPRLRTLTDGRGNVRHYNHRGDLTTGRICPACTGSGGVEQHNYGHPCPACGGWGWVRLTESTSPTNHKEQ